MYKENPLFISHFPNEDDTDYDSLSSLRIGQFFPQHELNDQESDDDDIDPICIVPHNEMNYDENSLYDDEYNDNDDIELVKN